MCWFLEVTLAQQPYVLQQWVQNTKNALYRKGLRWHASGIVEIMPCVLHGVFGKEIEPSIWLCKIIHDVWRCMTRNPHSKTGKDILNESKGTKIAFLLANQQKSQHRFPKIGLIPIIFEKKAINACSPTCQATTSRCMTSLHRCITDLSVLVCTKHIPALFSQRQHFKHTQTTHIICITQSAWVAA